MGAKSYGGEPRVRLVLAQTLWTTRRQWCMLRKRSGHTELVDGSQHLHGFRIALAVSGWFIQQDGAQASALVYRFQGGMMHGGL